MADLDPSASDLAVTPRPTAPLSLPERMYLLCYDLTRDKPGDDTALVRGQLLRAAAVAELRLDGRLHDRGGRAVRGGGAPDDPFLAEVLDAVPADAARRWFSVVDDRWWYAEASVRDGLAARGVLTVNRRRWLGVVPHRQVALTDPAAVRGLRERVRAVVLGGDPAGAPPPDAVLAVLAVDVDVDTVFTGRDRHEHRDAVRALGRHVETALPGLRAALVWSVAARRTAASA